MSADNEYKIMGFLTGINKWSRKIDFIINNWDLSYTDEEVAMIARLQADIDDFYEKLISKILIEEK